MEGLPRFATIGNERARIRDDPAIELGPNGMSLDLLRAVYRNSAISLSTRMRAAIAALPFESPKLAVTAQVSEQDFATLLDQRLARIEAMKTVEARAQPVEVKPPLPRLADRGFRRF
jgi:hypothetical protein